MDEKKAMRSMILKKLDSFTPDEIAQKSAVITEKLLSTTWWQEAELVCIYFSMMNEVSTQDMIDQARVENKTLAAPRITGNELLFHDCTHPGTVMTIHNYGIREPEPAAPIIDFRQFKAKILVIVPGLAFDYNKNRLGRGKGYYDKFINTLQKISNESIIKQITSIGICFTEQLMTRVPVTIEDERVNVIITNDNIIE